ncbi:YHS domain-containing protein [Natronorubrum sp. JWXQ-INN-674]|uniref:YHS domain-containing protein n=1 Tax=Natronorubrum halalkaliphilum TaxID=2691917 RepID=A0A6B0VQT2_9EURY|nr:XdhC family protein [Natronorubrum halalkaliphilum]MXV64161.1 YHS domain-containing protein [Natronorubrum halalkaliphilum]
MTPDTPPPDTDDTESPTDASDRAAAVTDGDLDRRERALADRREPYARATVVRREGPISANVGDRALITSDGDLTGWVGGAACAQSRVRSEARAAIEDGDPRLLGLAPDPDEIDRPGLDAFPMTCHSEGTLEVFVEPIVPSTSLLIVGGSQIARSLARLASELDVDITVVDPEAEAGEEREAEKEERDSEPTPAADGLPSEAAVLTTLEPAAIADAVAGSGPFVVVASMGEYDARGVAAGVLADAPYIGLVASNVRARTVVDRAAGLLDRDPETVRTAVTNPAGVDISAATGAEIAASVLAELIDVRAGTGAGAVTASATRCAEESAESSTAVPSADADDAVENGENGAETASRCGGTDEGETTATEATTATEPTQEPADESAIDPVCGMTVEPGDAPSVTHEGSVYHFCCHGCADAFRTDPDEYLETSEDEELTAT